MPSLAKTDLMKAYEAFEVRPAWQPAWVKGEDGKIVIMPGERFCRFDTGEGVLCEETKPFSSAGNLRKHANSHEPDVASKMAAGSSKRAETDVYAKMFRALVTPPQPKQDGDNTEDGSNDVADAASPLSTPVPTKAKKLPPVPKKRDGTYHKTQIRTALKKKSSCQTCENEGIPCCENADTCEYLQRFDLGPGAAAPAPKEPAKAKGSKKKPGKKLAGGSTSKARKGKMRAAPGEGTEGGEDLPGTDVEMGSEFVDASEGTMD